MKENQPHAPRPEPEFSPATPCARRRLRTECANLSPSLAAVIVCACPRTRGPVTDGPGAAWGAAAARLTVPRRRCAGPGQTGRWHCRLVPGPPGSAGRVLRLAGPLARRRPTAVGRTSPFGIVRTERKECGGTPWRRRARPVREPPPTGCRAAGHVMLRVATLLRGPRSLLTQRSASWPTKSSRKPT